MYNNDINYQKSLNTSNPIMGNIKLPYLQTNNYANTNSVNNQIPLPINNTINNNAMNLSNINNNNGVNLPNINYNMSCNNTTTNVNMSCNNNNSYNSESWSASVNLLTASQHLEFALRAEKCQDIIYNLQQCINSLKYAYDSLILGSNIYTSKQCKYMKYASQIDTLINQLKLYANNIQNSTYTQSTPMDIYNLQGVLGHIYKKIFKL